MAVLQRGTASSALISLDLANFLPKTVSAEHFCSRQDFGFVRHIWTFFGTIPNL